MDLRGLTPATSRPRIRRRPSYGDYSRLGRNSRRRLASSSVAAATKDVRRIPGGRFRRFGEIRREAKATLIAGRTFDVPAAVVGRGRCRGRGRRGGRGYERRPSVLFDGLEGCGVDSDLDRGRSAAFGYGAG